MRYRHLLFDLDHTLWDFESNSLEAFAYMFSTLELSKTLQTTFEDFHSKYLIHNKYYWNLYSNGGISQSDLRWRRMFDTLQEYNLEDEAKSKEMAELYLDHLPTCTHLFPHTKEVLNYLASKGYRMHILSNGFEKTQHQKLRHSGLAIYFDQIITSEGCGFVKPDARIFEHCISSVVAQKSECIMIGDSPEADLAGALNAGIDSIYVDHNKVNTAISHIHRIHSLQELRFIL